MKKTVSYFLDTRRPIKSGLYPVKLQVTYKRKTRAWNLGPFYSEEYYGKMFNNVKKQPYREQVDFLNGRQDYAKEVIIKLDKHFTFKDFQNLFFHSVMPASLKERTSFKNLMEELSKHYTKKRQFQMITKVQDSVNSLLKFKQKEIKDLYLEDITPEFCEDYEAYMVSKSATGTTNGCGINMRHIRIVFNYAIKKKYIDQTLYPFGEEKYMIPSQEIAKNPLGEDELWQLKEFYLSAQNETDKYAIKAFFTSYFFNGSNAADFLRLRYRDIVGDRITFYRRKIIRSKKHKSKPISIEISTDVRQLLNSYNTDSSDPTNYIVDCINKTDSEEEINSKVKKYNSAVTKSLRPIMKKLEFKVPLTMKNARHSFANILFTGGFGADFIKELLGHNSVITTERYLALMSSKKSKEASEMVSLKRGSNGRQLGDFN